MMLLIISLAIFLFFSPLQISGNSMYPNFKSGDIVCYNRFHNDIKVNDVIIFFDESDEKCIKRVLATEGDIVSSVDGQLSINGNIFAGCDYDSPITYIINSNEYFVVGDNYSVSIDSRNYGTISKNRIIGIVNQ